MVKSEFTETMPEDYAEKTAAEVAAMTEGQQREYAESMEPDMMGFSGKEGI